AVLGIEVAMRQVLMLQRRMIVVVRVLGAQMIEAARPLIEVMRHVVVRMRVLGGVVLVRFGVAFAPLVLKHPSLLQLSDSSGNNFVQNSSRCARPSLGQLTTRY